LALASGYNWRRHWPKKVAPHPDKEPVQASLDLRVTLPDPHWRRPARHRLYAR
jgi:hypothetical protein